MGGWAANDIGWVAPWWGGGTEEPDANGGNGHEAFFFPFSSFLFKALINSQGHRLLGLVSVCRLVKKLSSHFTDQSTEAQGGEVPHTLWSVPSLTASPSPQCPPPVCLPFSLRSSPSGEKGRVTTEICCGDGHTRPMFWAWERAERVLATGADWGLGLGPQQWRPRLPRSGHSQILVSGRWLSWPRLAPLSSACVGPGFHRYLPLGPAGRSPRNLWV